MTTTIASERKGGMIVNHCYTGRTEQEARQRLFDADERCAEIARRLRKLNGQDPDMESPTYEAIQPTKVVYDEEAGHWVATKVFRP